jgi:hypothetical protein
VCVKDYGEIKISSMLSDQPCQRSSPEFKDQGYDNKFYHKNKDEHMNSELGRGGNDENSWFYD